jgi:hypothetical protein
MDGLKIFTITQLLLLSGNYSGSLMFYQDKVDNREMDRSWW